MGGSSWSSAATYSTENGQRYFVKESRNRGIEMFLGEAKGLQAMYGRFSAALHSLKFVRYVKVQLVFVPWSYSASTDLYQ